MVSPRDIEELKNMLALCQKKFDEVQSLDVSGSGQEMVQKQEMLKRVLEKLQMAGVDLNDPTSVSAFLDKLRNQNPELAQYFEEAMNRLLEDEQSLPEQAMG